jgi:hypothetical protein
VKSGWLVSGAPALAALEPHEPVDRESAEVANPKSDPAPPEPNWLAAVGERENPDEDPADVARDPPSTRPPKEPPHDGSLRERLELSTHLGQFSEMTPD